MTKKQKQIEETFKYVNDYWKKEYYETCYIEWEEIQQFISKKQTPYQCTNCHTYWSQATYVNDVDNICPKCDTYCQPFLCNPINYQSVLKYINPVWHDYILPEDLLYCKRCYSTNIPNENYCQYCTYCLIKESFEFINDNWGEEQYSICYDEWEEVQKFISKEQTENYCIGCNTYWTKNMFVYDPCPNCDTWLEPLLCNPINHQNVLKYIDAKYHHYLIPPNQTETDSGSFLVKDNK